MKLLEKFRWLPTEMPWPGTADVSAKSWLLAVLVGDTPGTSSARSRKLRPLRGSDRTSVCDTVPATWVRAASSTAASPLTVTLVSVDSTLSATGSSKAAPMDSVNDRLTSAKPARWTLISYDPTLRYGKRNRPSR